MKEYTPIEAAKEVVKKIVELNKSMFNEGPSIVADEAPEDTKEDVFRKIKWAICDVKELRDLSWTIESEFPESKDIFTKYFNKKKSEADELISKYKKMKKSEISNEENELFESMEKGAPKSAMILLNERKDSGKIEVEKCGETKVDKCGDISTMKKSCKLKTFLENKKAKKVK